MSGINEHEFIITFAEISYKIGKGEIKTKEDVMNAVREGGPSESDYPGLSLDDINDNTYNLIMWALQDVLEDDKNPLYDVEATLPEDGPAWDPSWN